MTTIKTLNVIDDPKPEISLIRDSGFGRIADEIENSWNTYRLKNFLFDLVMDDRGDREGFPKEVLSSILKLYILHDFMYNKNVPNMVWDNDKR